MRISDWSSDVCSSDLVAVNHPVTDEFLRGMARGVPVHGQTTLPCKTGKLGRFGFRVVLVQGLNRQVRLMAAHFKYRVKQLVRVRIRSEEHTSELQSLMRISYAVFCLKKKKKITEKNNTNKKYNT